MLLLNNSPVDYFKFPGGELQVRLPPKIEGFRVNLTWKPTNSDHIVLLMMTVNALNKQGIVDIDLEVLYLPYARQDRVCSPGEAYGLEVITRLLKALPLSTIRIFDPHNLVITSHHFVSDSVKFWEVHHIFNRYNMLQNFDLSNLRFCAPDRSAAERIYEITGDKPIIFNKKRNPKSGVIEGLTLDSDSPNFDGYEVLVIDDICDGGKTFIEAAKEIRKNTAENLYLYVTHGIFSKGLDELLTYYKHIYCHHVLDDSKYQSNENLTILREFPHGY